MPALPRLRRMIEDELAQPVSAGAHALTAAVRARHGTAVRAVVFYGSCLRTRDDHGVLDLYVLVDDYRHAYTRRTLRWLNRALPPNVFFLEARVGERVVRAKYAVLTLDALGSLVASDTFEPYFWARFAQPCALVYAADDAVRASVVDALATAVATFVSAGIPLVAPRFSARELWVATLRQTYRAELRAERPHIAETLVAAAPERYDAVTRVVLAAMPEATAAATDGDPTTFHVPLTPAAGRRAHRVWYLRRLVGKALFLSRLLRNALIFEGGVEYVLWKIQRHSGVAVDRGWREKRHPLLALGAEAWRLYRAGAFR